MVTAQSLLEFKTFFDTNLQDTLSSLGPSDSDRLVKNKINGFLITLLDKMLELKPKLRCHGCGLIKREYGSALNMTATAMSHFTSNSSMGEQ